MAAAEGTRGGDAVIDASMRAPVRTYRCPCSASVELAPGAPLPDGWATVPVASRRGMAGRTGYRCGRCTRRQLVMALLADDIALRTVKRVDARRLANWCIRQEIDERGIRVVVGRMQAERAAGTWAEIVDRATGGTGEMDR